MRVTLVNHASVILEAAGVRLLVDPWIEGAAFDDGWEHLVPTPLRADDFASVTHIWLSHEHPDHFSPPNLRAFPEALRRNITVLYQDTRDRKVLDYCARLGFQTLSLPRQKVVELAPDFKIYCETVPFYDSWSCIRAEGYTVVNLNDCELSTPEQLRTLREQTGPADLLLSQFSYANWSADLPKLATRILDRLVMQAEALDAKATIPFASYIRFCHADNQRLNTSVNSVADAAAALATRTSTKPIVLYVGERWNVGEAHDNASALARWQSAYAAIPQLPQRKSVSVPLADLERQSAEYLARIRSKNSPHFIAAAALLGLFPTVVIHLRDLDQSVTFDVRRGVRRSPLPKAAADISMHSESLSFALRFDYGPDTLYVNGRVDTNERGMNKFMKAFSVGVLNNTGRQFRPSLITDPVFLRQVPAILSQFLRGGSRVLREVPERTAPPRA